jgi:excinuclease ABC subunit C
MVSSTLWKFRSRRSLRWKVMANRWASSRSRVSRKSSAEAAEKGFVAEAERTPERVFLPVRKDPIVLRQNSAELFLLTRLRDEAHRFAITFHRKLRRERNFQSVLETIPGVGEGRKKVLLRHFGALKRIREATLDELGAVEGFGEKQARAVFGFFHPPEGAPAAAEAVTAEPTEAEIDAALAEEDAVAS